jgi:hypothetical protein
MAWRNLPYIYILILIYIYISIYKGSARGDTPNFYGQKYGTNLAPFYDQFPLIIVEIHGISI